MSGRTMVRLSPERVNDVFWRFGEPVTTVAKRYRVMTVPTLRAALRDAKANKPMSHWRAMRLAEALGVSIMDLKPEFLT